MGLNAEKRKLDHLDLASHSQSTSFDHDRRFDYEPMLSAHPPSPSKQETPPFTFLGKEMGAPLWISSMTGGTKRAFHINENLARVCAEFKLGLGLGSCRSLLESKHHLPQFNWRSLLVGRPFYANLGLAQVEQLLMAKQKERIVALVEQLSADGLIVHVNPLQEWFQREGDRFKRPPLETIRELLESVSFKVIVKEVGQGFGPRSLKALLELPLAAIDFAAFGGTNFSKLEMLREEGEGKEREKKQAAFPLGHVGHTAEEMVSWVLALLQGEDRREEKCRDFIVSGGVKSFLDGLYFKKRLEQIKGVQAVYGQAKALLERACGPYDDLRSFVATQIEGWFLAECYLHLKAKDRIRGC